MLVLLPALAFAQQLRAPSDSETGPRGLACKDPAAAFRRGVFALSVGRVTLRGGKACVSPGAERSTCEWDVELTRVERWGSAGPLLVVVTATHDGPGTWDSVFFYACRNDVLVQVHSRRYLYGAYLSHTGRGPRIPDAGSGVPVRDSHLLIASGEWRKGDGGCCPSLERLESFEWDARTGKVVLRQTEVRSRVKK